MPKICYRPKKFNADRADKIEKANAIIEEYRQQGFELTLRQLYYQFVSRDFIANNMREYKNLGDIINDARLAGLIDWEAIVDRTRNLQSLSNWETPAEIIKACANQYRIDKWAEQQYRVECFLPDTPVITRAGLVEIASLQVGDVVLSHTGRWRRVTKLIQNQYDGPLLKIKPVGCLPIGVTPRHPFYAHAADRSKPSYKGSKRKYFNANWMYSEALQQFDLLCVPNLPNRKLLPPSIVTPFSRRAKRYRVKLNDDTLRVIGLYLAEGNVRGDGRTLQFTFGSHETAFEQTVTHWAKSVGVGFSTAFGKGTRIVYVYSKTLAAWFETEFGSGAWNKRLPGWLFEAPVGDQLAVLQYYFLGDGSFWDETRSSCRATTRSQLLAQTIHFLLLTAGFPACIGTVQDHGKPRYSVEVSGKSAENLAHIFGVKIPAKGLGRSSRHNYIKITETGIKIPVNKVTSVNYTGPVFNLEVEEDHSYCVPVAVHNCWIEKDALVGVIEGVCNDLDIDYFSCRGYTSQSEMWSAAMRLRGYIRNAQVPLILHLGDHDPSGKDMTRDITDRLAEFSGQTIEVKRLALNMPQVEQYNPPPNPAKITDSRAEKYIEEFGQESWELDALEPAVIAELIRNAVYEVRDVDQWDDAVTKEEEQKAQLGKVSAQWADIIDNLK